MAQALHHDQARRLARGAQVAAVALVGLAAVSLVFGRNAGPVDPVAAVDERAASARETGGPNLPPPKTDERVIPTIDVVSIAEMSKIGLDFNEPEPPKQPETEGSDPGEDPTKTPAGGLRFLGAMIGSKKRLAMVEFDGSKRYVQLGRDLDGGQLVAVEPEFIEIERNGDRERVDRAERVGSLVTTLANPQSTRAVDPRSAAGIAERAAAAREQRRLDREREDEETPAERYRRIREEQAARREQQTRIDPELAREQQLEARRLARERAIESLPESVRRSGSSRDRDEEEDNE